MSASHIQVAADDPSGKKVQTFLQNVGGEDVHAQAVVLVDSSGSPITPITSAPYSDTARVDPSGDDSTGVIGEPVSKPFLTVQAAINAAQAASTGNLLIDIGNNSFDESLTVTSLSVISFTSQGYLNKAFNSITFADPTATVNLYCNNVQLGSINAATSSYLNIVLDNAFCGNVTNTAGPVAVYSDVGTCQIGNVTAAGQLELDGGIVDAGTVSAPGFPIYIVNCKTTYLSSGSTDYTDAITVNSAGSTVYVTDSVLAAVTAAGTLHLKDSRVQGTNNATSTVYADVLLAGDDTAYDATSWNGDTRTPSKNAVRDKFETLGTLSTQNGTFSGTHSGASSGTNTGDQDLTSYSSIGLAAGLAIALG